MSRSDFNHMHRQRAAFDRFTTREAHAVIHRALMKRFEDTHDFPLHREKYVADNAPDSNEKPRIFPTPWHGSKRAYLRRRERGML